MGKRIEVNEPRRTTVFDTGERADFHNVSWFDKSGTHLRLQADEGIAIINTSRVLFHLIQPNAEYQQTIADGDLPDHTKVDETAPAVGLTGGQED